MLCFFLFNDDLGTPPTWRPHSWKKPLTILLLHSSLPWERKPAPKLLSLVGSVAKKPITKFRPSGREPLASQADSHDFFNAAAPWTENLLPGAAESMHDSLPNCQDCASDSSWIVETESTCKLDKGKRSKNGRGSKVLLSSKKRTTSGKQSSHPTEISTQHNTQDTFAEERYRPPEDDILIVPGHCAL